MTIYLLPAPRFDWLLPAWSSPAPLDRIQPRQPLTESESALLLAGLLHHAAEESYRSAALGELGVSWFPISKHSRTSAGNLVMYGYLEKHPDKRKKMWYRLTADGLIRARAEQVAEEAEAEHGPIPSDPQARLVWLRRRNLRALTRELAHQGFVVYPEEGRGLRAGEQAFYNVFSREIRLYRVRLGRADWELRRDGYYPAGASVMSLAEMEAIPF